MSFSFRLIGAICVFVCGTAGGFIVSDKLKNRKDFLKDFIAFLSALEINIRYRCSDIVDVVKRSAPKGISGCFDFSYDDFSAIWSNFTDRIKKTSELKDEEINLITEFGSKIGTTDADGELNNILLYKEFFEKSYYNSLEEYKTKSKLYKTLGCLFGAVVAIIII